MAYYTINNSSRLIHYLKLIDETGGIEERVIWSVPISGQDPDGIRYRLAYVPKGFRKPLVLYDNHYPKGHHKHIHSGEFRYEFSDIAKLLSDFKSDAEGVRAYNENL